MNRKIFKLFLPVLLALAMPVYAHAQPTAENCEIITLINTPAHGTLRADGGEELRFFVTTEPVKGELVLDEDGYYTYTPDTNRRGRDYFGFRITDETGTVSQEATVIIRIKK